MGVSGMAMMVMTNSAVLFLAETTRMRNCHVSAESGSLVCERTHGEAEGERKEEQ